MQMTPIAYRPAFGAAKPQAARFGSQDVSTTAQNTLIRLKKTDPEFMEALEHNEQALKQFHQAVQNGTVEFVSAKEGLEFLKQIQNKAVWPQITFKLDQKLYQLTIRSLHSQKGTAYEIKSLDGERSEFEFKHYPKGPWMSSTTIEMGAFQNGQSKLMSWDEGGIYFPQSQIGARSPGAFPRPGLVAQATDLGKLLLYKLGESRKNQGLEPFALAEPQKQLDHHA